jgi:hypothetical protein
MVLFYLLWLYIVAAEEQGVKPELLSERYKMTSKEFMVRTPIFIRQLLP